MVVRLRISRLGFRNKPFYRVMAADSRSPRDGKHLEVLGYYNPLPGNSVISYTSQDGGKRMVLNFDRLKDGSEDGLTFSFRFTDISMSIPNQDGVIHQITEEEVEEEDEECLK